MDQLAHTSGGQTDLVAVGGVAGCGAGGNIALRQLALEGLLARSVDVTCAGQTHGLVDPRATRQRVADCATETGRGATEWLDFGRVVVGLVLEHEEPLAVIALDVDVDGAGVDFFGDFLVIHDTRATQFAAHDGAHVHQGAWLVRATVELTQLVVATQRAIQLRGKARLVVLDGGQLGVEGGVAAVVRPVGIQRGQLYLGRSAALGAEVILDGLQVGQRHGHAVGCEQLGQAFVIQLGEARVLLQRLNLAHARTAQDAQVLLPRFDRVDEEGAHGVIHRSIENIQRCRGDLRLRFRAEQAQGLLGGIGTLVVLARKRLDSKIVPQLGGGRELDQLVDTRISNYRLTQRDKILLRRIERIVEIVDCHLAVLADRGQQRSFLIAELGLTANG